MSNEIFLDSGKGFRLYGKPLDSKGVFWLKIYLVDEERERVLISMYTRCYGGSWNLRWRVETCKRGGVKDWNDARKNGWTREES